MSIALKRPFPFCNSPLSSSFTPEHSHSIEVTADSHPLSEQSDVDMSGCQPVTRQFHNLSNSKNPAPFMNSSSSTGPRSFQHSHTSHSTSTSASSSNNSSPTTTISTSDSASTDADTLSTDSNSPMTTILPLSDFSSSNMGRISDEDLTIIQPVCTTSSYHPQTLSPSKKPRNTKNLSLHVPPPVGVPRPPPTGIDPSMQGVSPRSLSAPNSPAFILPPPPPAPKRKPSSLGLTIKLPTTLGQSGGIKAVGGGLRHHQSSPSLFSPGPNALRFPSSTFGQSRMYHPPRKIISEARAASEGASNFSASPTRTTQQGVLHEMDEEDEPRSGESKSPAYPHGPACIFEPNVFLFAEPDADLASTFDVVINVAREVLNPFDERDKRASKALGGFSRRESMVPPDTSCTEASFKTAFEEATFSPIKQSQMTFWPAHKRPEYIHKPWDHSTAIVDELPELVNIIRDRVDAGKRVLVHCQCGVSRSASLLIAYALFMKPQQTVQEAYDSVKQKSRWIGPNMSLIYQLSEWKSRLGRENLGQPGFRPGLQTSRTAPNSTFGRKIRSLNGNLAAEEMDEPLTAPLPQLSESCNPLRQTSLKPIPQMVRTRSANGSLLGAHDPGPSSAPPGMMTIPYKNLPETPRIAPDIPAETQNNHLMEREHEKKHKVVGAIRPENEKPGLSFGLPDEEEAPGFQSPRNSGYFGFGIPLRRELPGFVLQDPRSPNRGIDTPIIRSIFDVL